MTRTAVTVQTKQRLTAEARRQAVLDAACTFFSRSSYRGATTAEIAREAGISEPILYRHFGSKRDLYLACLDEAWRSFREVAEKAIAEDPERCLGAIADAYMAKRSRIRMVDLWIQSLAEASDDAVIAAGLRKQVREVHDFFAEVIRRVARRRPAACAQLAPCVHARRRVAGPTVPRREKAPAAAPGAFPGQAGR